MWNFKNVYNEPDIDNRQKSIGWGNLGENALSVYRKPQSQSISSQIQSAPIGELSYNTEPQTDSNITPLYSGQKSSSGGMSGGQDYGGVISGAVSMYQEGAATMKAQNEDDVSVYGTGLSMMGKGASAGSAFGPIGTAVGAAVGLVAGVAVGASARDKARKRRRRREKKEREDMLHNTFQERERNARLAEGQEQIDAEIALRQQQLGLINNY